MTKINIKLLAFKNAPESVFSNAKNRIEKIISSEKYIITDINPDILFFLSGGSELSASQSANIERFNILIGSRHDNSYASATEVKALLNAKGIRSLLLDEEEFETKEFLSNFLKVKEGLEKLNNSRLGQIGKISDWLVSSTISDKLLKEKLGIHLIEIPWDKISHFSNYSVSSDFLSAFDGKGEIDLSDTSRVNEMLTDVIKKWNLDAITVECFPLVQNEGVTACLPLSLFNDLGIPAGCEGDLTAIVGMMLGKEIAGTIPWIANINKVSEEYCLFSHCTIARDLVDNYSVTTHFETGKGSAIAGNFKNDIITIFRVDNSLSNAFIAIAHIEDRPNSCTSCRTQIKVKLSANKVRSLKDIPLGNHHLIFSGNHVNLLSVLCNMLNINIL